MMTWKLEYIIITFLIIFMSASGNAEKNTLITADPFPSERPGQYIYYHDMRKGVYGDKEPLNRLFGILKADNKQYIIRVGNLKNGKSYLFLGHYVLKNGVLEFLTESIQGDAKEGTVIMAELLNLMNYIGSESINYSKNINNSKDLVVNSTWESYKRKLVNRYKWWIPFYKLDSSMNQVSDAYGDKNYLSFKLVCFGTVSQSDPDMFTRIDRLPVYYTEKLNDKKYIIPATEKIKVKLDNTTFNLDHNWHYEKGDQFNGINDSYVLKKFTARDAQVGVESIELSNIKVENNIINTFASTLQFQSCVISDTVVIDFDNKTLSLSLWDADSGTATFTKYKSLNVKKNLLTTLNFSALDFIYYCNMNYFNAIINSDFNN